MTHSNIALNVQRRGSRKAECLHVRVHLRLEHARFRPRAAETRDELVVHGTTGEYNISLYCDICLMTYEICFVQ